MFVLEELDKLLGSIGIGKKRSSKAERFKLSLDDVPIIDVERLQMLTKIQFPTNRAHKDPNPSDAVVNRYVDNFLSAHKHLTVDLLFVTMMKSVLAARLSAIPERHYASARLMICDADSFESVMKFQQNLDKMSSPRNLVYRNSMKITAVFRLEDIIDQVDRTRKPIVIARKELATGEKVGSYNYSIIKEVFPYLKMCDLIIVLNDAKDLDITAFSFDDRREYRILQFLCFYARTSRLIDLRPIFRAIGQQYRTYHNVSIFKPERTMADQNVHLKPQLSHLSFLASRLTHLAQRLRLSLRSISYRNGDPSGCAKILSRAAESMFRSERGLSKSAETLVSARVLVLDRYFDLQSLLYHTEHYGAFIDQESDPADGFMGRTNHLVDALDGVLQFEKLTDVLNTILKHTVNLKPTDPDVGSEPAKLGARLSSVIPTNQSIRMHMDNIRLTYKLMNEGYLLILRLEASLKEIYGQLKNLNEPLPVEMQTRVVDRLNRISSALLQLIKISGKSIRLSSLIRTACILIDVVNVFSFIHSKNNPSAKLLKDLKNKFLIEKNFKSFVKLKLDGSSNDEGDKEIEVSSKYDRKLELFDRISLATCSHRAISCLEELIEKFALDQLDGKSFTRVDLSSSKQIITKDELLIVIVLGSMSFDEVSRVKILESSIKTKLSNISDILLINCGIIKPKDFLTSLMI